jgi:hypothetical protein
LRKPLLWRGPMILVSTFLVSVLSLSLSGQEEATPAGRFSVISDWTMHHMIYPRFGTSDRLLAAQRDPRAMFSWLRFGMLGGGEFHPVLPPFGEEGSRSMRTDWDISLGPGGGTAPNMYPAKFTFNVTATPSCTNDFVIFPVNAAGSATQANLVAFNNLYSGTGAGGTGSCNRPPVHDDVGTSATVLWSYNIDAIHGGVTTSPVISWDVAGASPSVLGVKVAFVESAAGSPAHFHVLAWKDGAGQDTTDADGLQNTQKPAQITTFLATAPVAGSGTATDLELGIATTGTDTRSSPFIDYGSDTAYVGNDIGVLYRIKNVFCPSFNHDAGCTAGSAPTLDTTWGVGGAVTVCTGILTGAIKDFATGNVFVGCSDGKLYGLSSTGTPLSPASVTVGNGSAPFGSIVDPPIVDGANGVVYAVSGSNGTNPVVVQTRTNFSTFTGEASNTNTATLGGVPTGGTAANFGTGLHVPGLNGAYLFSSTSVDWVLYSCGYNAAGTHITLFDIGFNVAVDGTREMKTGTPPAANQSELAAHIDECSPTTDFLNVEGPPIGATDWLFVDRTESAIVRSYNVTTVTSTGFPTPFTETASSGQNDGTSGMIVDNQSSTVVQASSIYFSRLGTSDCAQGGHGFCAVKLTQSGLN